MNRNGKKIKIVFFPYKASMWDSLESIYLAAAADERCEAIVCPIPYYEIEQNTNRRRIRYEGDLFPEDIPITKYSDLDMDEEHIDIAYIHNPYDDANLVTRVHKNFYSSELKKKVGTLVYVPYYADFGSISDSKKMLPAYYYADYIAFPTRRAKESCKDMPYYRKILAMGSPKFDRIVRKCQEGAKVPDEWRTAFEGKKVLLLNTSIYDLLTHNEKLLKKLEYLFDEVKKYPDIAILWRPHPLLGATIKSMRPQLEAHYQRLLDTFEEESIGLVDATPDVTESVVFADGYLTFGGSSVDTLAVVAGKPVFTFDFNVFTNTGAIKYPLAVGKALSGNKIFVIFWGIGALFSFDKDDWETPMQLEGIIDEETLWRKYQYRDMTIIGNKLYVKGIHLTDSKTYDFEKKSFASMYTDRSSVELESSVYWGPLVESGENIVFVSYNNPYSVKYRCNTRRWRVLNREVAKLLNNYTLEGNTYFISQSYACYDEKLYISNATDDRILCIDLKKDRENMIILKKNNGSKVTIKGANSAGLWFVDRCELDRIYCAPWNSLNDADAWHTYKLGNLCPGSYVESRKAGLVGNVVEMANCFIIEPAKIPRLFRIDKQTNGISALADDFWDEKYQNKEGYDRRIDDIIMLKSLKLDEEHILIQCYADGKWVKINVDDNTYTTHTIDIPNNIKRDLIKINKGFAYDKARGIYHMTESNDFSISSFLENIVNNGFKDEGEKGRVLCFKHNGVDNCCGEGIHSYMMKLYK